MCNIIYNTCSNCYFIQCSFNCINQIFQLIKTNHKIYFQFSATEHVEIPMMTIHTDCAAVTLMHCLFQWNKAMTWSFIQSSDNFNVKRRTRLCVGIGFHSNLDGKRSHLCDSENLVFPEILLIH